MLFRSRHALNRRFIAGIARRGVCVLLLIAFVVTAAGIPLPAGRGLQKSGELFPCAQSSCGCATADQCWRSCCCHTLAERIIWARDHGVQPPAYVVARANREGISLAAVEGPEQSRTDHQPGPSCCAKGASKTPSCCETADRAIEQVAKSCCSERGKTKPGDTSDRTILAWQAFRCSGKTMDWLAAAPSLAGVRTSFVLEMLPTSWLMPASVDFVQCPATLPSVPPPEQA